MLNLKFSENLRHEPTRLDAMSILSDPRKRVSVSLGTLLERKRDEQRRSGFERVVGRRHGAADVERRTKLTLLFTQHLREVLDVRLEVTDDFVWRSGQTRKAIAVHKIARSVLQLFDTFLQDAS